MKTRIISGVLITAIVVLILILHQTVVFPIAIAILTCMALYELYRAGKCLHCRISVAAGYVYGASLSILQYYGNYTAEVALIFLCMMAMFSELVLLHKRTGYQETFYVAAVTFLVSGAMNMLVLLLQTGSYGLGYVILAIGSACISDTGAYFTGTFLGKHKLCPEISPKKTVEGFFGGIVSNIVVMVLFGWVYGRIMDAHVCYWWLIFVAAGCSVVSVLGDLSASVLKRQLQMKDFGNLIPGHGGIMDRIDSVLFTVPACYVLVCMIPVFYV